ncbi:MAG: Hsp70 family protein, partial [Clostridiales bacterium]|nr:Hsp70 family protein [Clostridiales bacterium]
MIKYGIDLGTTYSCIAYVDDQGEVRVINNAEGENITPSVVKYNKGAFEVGRKVKNEAVLYPELIVEAVKRSMGATLKNGKPAKIIIDGTEFYPQEISAAILRKLVNDANKYLKADVKDVVITVPAYFGQEERNATAEAAKIAGLNLIKIVDEPTAAAICYQNHRSDSFEKHT